MVDFRLWTPHIYPWLLCMHNLEQLTFNVLLSFLDEVTITVDQSGKFHDLTHNSINLLCMIGFTLFIVNWASS